MNITELSTALRSNADALARFLLPGGRYDRSQAEWECSGKSSPTGDSISVHVAPGEKQGICGFWNNTPAGGDMLDLIQLVYGFKKRDAIDWATSWLGSDDFEPHAPRPNLKQMHRRDEDSYTSVLASSIWKSSGPLEGPALTYLESRGLDSRLGDRRELRFHHGLDHPSGGTFPALIARVCDVGGSLTGIWRTYLKMDGTGKAPVDAPKMGLGRTKGGAVRLRGVWPEIGITEGIETALACHEIIRRDTGKDVPVWAALSTSGMRGIQLPDGVGIVRIFADGDTVRWRNDKLKPSPGLEAARDLEARLKGNGIAVAIHSPPAGKDWLDVLQANKATEKSHEMRGMSGIGRAA